MSEQSSIKPYNDFGSWIRKRFPFKIQKISIDAGFTCPNRDGKVGWGGCSFCDNNTFNPAYCSKEKSIKQQLQEGKLFFKEKYPSMRYLAYFQAYTNTYGDLDTLKAKYEEALGVEDIVGLVIATRPDAVDDKILSYLEKLSKETFLIVEYGIESTSDITLKKINRGHNFECSYRAIFETSSRGIITSGHVILGLPGEDEHEIMRQAVKISSTKLDILKCHQLQIIKGTKLSESYKKEAFHLYSLHEYVKLLAKYIQLLRKDLVLERFLSQAPKDMLIAPDWGIKNYEFTNLFVDYLNKTGAYQGKLYSQDLTI